MKLQLTASESRTYAAIVGGKTDVLSDANATLAAFAAQGHDPFTRRDMNSVLNLVGHSLPTDGDVWYALSAAILAVAERSGRRGYWTQAHLVRSVSAPASAPALGPLSEAAASGESIEVVHKAGASWLPALPVVGEAVEGYYAEDVGLRRIAVANSACFGSHSSKAAVCGKCPLARFCANASLAALSDIAARLDAETAGQVAAAAAATAAAAAAAAAALATEALAAEEAANPTPAPDVFEAFDQALAARGTTSMPGSAEAQRKARLDSKYGEDGWEIVSLPFDGVCSECDGQVSENAEVVHVGGCGMYHPDCA